MKTLYSKANLIHADLSEYNILWYNDQCYFIDVSQSVELNQEKAFHFLMRDCGNISNVSKKKYRIKSTQSIKFILLLNSFLSSLIVKASQKLQPLKNYLKK